MFLLDGLTVCCRAKAKGGVKDKMYRFKEKINMRKVTLVDLPESDGEWQSKHLPNIIHVHVRIHTE